MNIYFPHKLKKGQSFRFDFGTTKSGQEFRFNYNESSPWIIFISKDDGNFVSATNSVVYLGEDTNNDKSFYYINLTAEEMNANKIILTLRTTDTIDSTEAMFVVFYTDGFTGFQEPTGTGLSYFSPAVFITISQAINAGYALEEMALDENGYNYYGLTKARNPWWIIIQEPTDLMDIGYITETKKFMKFNNAWNNRASLTYNSSIVIN